jgi:hypothetical protein
MSGDCVEKILRHPGAGTTRLPAVALGEGRPPRPPPAAVPGPCTYEPCEDVDPMPDYENVLTD